MKILATILFALLGINLAFAQTPSQLATSNQSISITAGNTYQAISPSGQSMKSLTIQNTNTSDNCFIEISGIVAVGNTLTTAVTITGKPASTAQHVSILLGPGQSYSRYAPYIPTGPIVGTCAVTGDSIYVDWQ